MSEQEECGAGECRAPRSEQTYLLRKRNSLKSRRIEHGRYVCEDCYQYAMGVRDRIQQERNQTLTARADNPPAEPPREPTWKLKRKRRA